MHLRNTTFAELELGDIISIYDGEYLTEVVEIQHHDDYVSFTTTNDDGAKFYWQRNHDDELEVLAED